MFFWMGVSMYKGPEAIESSLHPRSKQQASVVGKG